MAAVTAAIVTGATAAASAYSSYRGAKAQERAQRQAQRRLEEGIFGNISIGGGAGGPSGSYNPETGRITTSLGDRLTGQLGQVDAFADLFASQMGGNPLGRAFGTLADREAVAYGMQPDANLGLFDNLQGRAQGALDIAGLNLGARAQDAVNLQGIGDQAFGMIGGQLGQLNSFDQQGVLDLMRQQAQPFESRAFQGMLDNQFATGRLGSSGGALQTEAFARGLAQADTSRQLQSFAESRNFQNQIMNNAQGLFGLGGAQRSLSDSLLSSAFSNFGGMAGLASDIEGQRFQQAGRAQNNLFDQLGVLMQNQIGLPQAQQAMQGQNFGNFLRALTAGQAINQIPMDQLQNALAFETARSNAAIGSGTAQLGVQRGQGADALASAFGGLSSAFGAWGGQGGWMGLLQGLGGAFGNNSGGGGT